jgi:hypothetical protein
MSGTNKTRHFILNVSLSSFKLMVAQSAHAAVVSRWPKARAFMRMHIPNVTMFLI